MAYKTILVHCTDERRFDQLTRPALALARRFEAHVTGLAVLPPPIIDPAMLPGGGGSAVIESHRHAFEKERAGMKARFMDAVRQAGVNGEWIDADAKPWPVWRKVVEYASASDLVVAMQSDPDWPLSAMLEAHEELVLHSGRPVLLIPNSGEHTQIGKRVLIAWNGRREAARAAFDAVPILQGAELTRVIWVNPQDDSELASDVPSADLCIALARHKVRCEATEAIRPDVSVGNTLLSRVRDYRCDLLVMGCYGHTRLREFVLGGATRSILQHMNVPVLMSH